MKKFPVNISRHGPAVLAAGCAVGLLVPWLADVAKPLVPSMIFIFVFGTLLRINNVEIWRAAKDIRVSLWFPLLMVLGCPWIFGLASLYVLNNEEIALAVALAVASPPASGNAAVARMLGLDVSTCIVSSVCSMAIIPFTAPSVLYFFGQELGYVIDPAELGARLLVLVGSAGGLTLLIRAYFLRQVEDWTNVIDGVVIVSLLFFSIGTMAGLQGCILEEPFLVLSMVAAAYVINVTMQLFFGCLYPGPVVLKFTMALSGGNRNVGLLWSALGATISPTVALFFACSQIPIHTMPQILKYALPKIHRTLHTAPRA